MIANALFSGCDGNVLKHGQTLGQGICSGLSVKLTPSGSGGLKLKAFLTDKRCTLPNLENPSLTEGFVPVRLNHLPGQEQVSLADINTYGNHIN